MVQVAEDYFGQAINPVNKQNDTIRRFTISNSSSMSVQIITYGATIYSLKIPDVKGNIDDIVLGFDDIAGYQTKNNPYFGATVGRVCNRIGHGRFKLNGKEIQVSRNLNDTHQLHGGFLGFDKVHWTVSKVHSDGVTLQHSSPAGHEGFPGEVTATVRFSLTEDNCLHVHMEATTTEPTPINMTNHAYFNLAGHNAGKKGIEEHSIMIKASSITETDDESIPTGCFTSVEGTPYDLRKKSNLGKKLQNLLPTNGFDDNFCVELLNNSTTNIARVEHPGTGRWMEIASNQPGVQFYTSNFMPDSGKGETPILGKSGSQYGKQSALCLETQKYPDSVNHIYFPSTIIKPNEKYCHEVIYKFGVSEKCGSLN